MLPITEKINYLVGLDSQLKPAEKIHKLRTAKLPYTIGGPFTNTTTLVAYSTTVLLDFH